jgi:hypothetical protein
MVQQNEGPVTPPEGALHENSDTCGVIKKNT